MPLIRNGRIIEDPYLRAVDGAPIPEGAAVLVPAERLLADFDALAARAGALGVIWPNGRNIVELAPFLGRLALVALVFPNFRDGRAYSQARILRERLRFPGELRATGEVLRDQLLFLQRVGFDAFEVAKPRDALAFTDSIARYSVFYQPATDRRAPALRQRAAALAG